MALPETYMTSVKNLPGIMAAIQDAGVPDKFTFEFLKKLGFASSGDRPMVGLLKSLGFLDESGVPTDRYRSYRDKTQARKVLARAIRSAYSDVFLSNENAHNLGSDKIKGIISASSNKGEAVVEKMAMTFRTLCGLADFSEEAKTVVEPDTPAATDSPGRTVAPAERERLNPTFHYDIEIHLPVTKDISVYNAIFKSLREHLLD